MPANGLDAADGAGVADGLIATGEDGVAAPTIAGGSADPAGGAASGAVVA